MNPHRARFAEVVRSEPLDLGLACLLLGGEVDPDLDQDAALARLDALAAAVRPHLPERWSAAGAVEALRGVLGRFSGTPADYADVRSSLLHAVLERERGLPLLLSILWLEVCARLDVPAFALALPGHVVVGVGDPDDEHVLVDPFSGGRPMDPAALPPGPHRPATAAALLLRLLTNVRALATRSDRLLESTRTHLWAVQLSLLLPTHPLALRREHGHLLVRLGDALGGAAVLEEYAALVEGADAAEADVARREARLARATLN